MGSIRATVDDIGQVVGYDDYDPWGLTMAGRSMATGLSNLDAAKNRFTSKAWDDEFGLDWNYFGARYYDPVIVRWLSVDPLADQLPGWSPYNYTLNNPTNLIDPTGLMPEEHDGPDEVPNEIREYLSQFFDFSKIVNKIKVTLFDAAEEAPGFVAERAAADAVELTNMTVEAVDRINTATEKSAEVVADVSGGGVVGGLLISGVGLLGKNPNVTGLGLRMTASSISFGTGADLTATASKGVDVAFFDGSAEEFLTQSRRTAVNVGIGKVVNTVPQSIASRTFWNYGYKALVRHIFVN